MTDTTLREFLLSSSSPPSESPGTASLEVEFARTVRGRCHRAIARFQWSALAFYTLIALDVWRQGPRWEVAVAWLLFALLATVGPAIGARRMATYPMRTQVRFCGQVEAVTVLMSASMVPALVLAVLRQTAVIEVPTSVLVATFAITVPGLALLYRWLARAMARRFDPEWWE